MWRLIAKVLLWLFVINLGIAFGAGLFEARIAFPQWFSYSPESVPGWNAEAARQANTGLRFWVYVTTVPLTLLTLTSLIAVWWTHGSLRRWWLIAAVFALTDRIFTFSYFVPTMVKLMNDENLSQSQATAMAVQWGNWKTLKAPNMHSPRKWSIIRRLFLQKTSMNPPGRTPSWQKATLSRK